MFYVLLRIGNQKIEYDAFWIGLLGYLNHFINSPVKTGPDF